MSENYVLFFHTEAWHTGELLAAAPSSLCLPIQTPSERFRSQWSAADSARCTVSAEDDDPGQIQNLMTKALQFSWAYRGSNAVSRTVILYHCMSANAFSQWNITLGHSKSNQLLYV